MNPLLDVKDLQVQFKDDFGEHIVTDHISFSVAAREFLGIVGESGSGKSVTSLAIMRLLGENGRLISGSVSFDGKELLQLSEKEMNRLCGKDLCMINQDALTALDPSFTAGYQITETIRTHITADKRQARHIAEDVLGAVGIKDPEQLMRKYPHELSGGMRQRLLIAMAVACNPKLLIADEPTTALDVTIQAEIMRLLQHIQKTIGMAMVLITHDIGLIAQMVDRVMVMYAGQIIEEAEVKMLFAHPLHPYTRMLLASAPGVQDAKSRRLENIRGSVPEDYASITGCRFAARCPFADESCQKPQTYRELASCHKVRCHKAREIAHV